MENMLTGVVCKNLGQLKLAISGSVQSLTVTILEIRGVAYIRREQSVAYVRLSLCPDTPERERYKTSMVPVRGQKVTFQEAFNLRIPDENASRRLLISVWQRLDHKDSSEFIGCMSFNVHKLTVEQKIINGWYQLLSETLGRRKHLWVRNLPDTDKGRPCGKSGDVAQDRPRQLGERHNNTLPPEHAIDSYYKRYFSIGDSPKDTMISEEKENACLRRQCSASKLSKNRHLRKNPRFRRSLSKLDRPTSNHKQEALTASRRRLPKQTFTPSRRISRDHSESPKFVLRSAFVKPYRTKSARIVSHRRQQPQLQQDCGDIRVLYTDETECAEDTVLRPISISSHEEVVADATKGDDGRHASANLFTKSEPVALTKPKKTIAKRFWKKIPSHIDEERGYSSDPEIRHDVTKVYYYCPAIYHRPIVVGHSNHKPFELDNVHSVKDKTNALTLNEISLGEESVNKLEKGRKKSYLFIAFREPFEEVSDSLALDSTLVDDSKLNLENVKVQQPMPREILRSDFGSNWSLCSERTHGFLRDKRLFKFSTGPRTPQARYNDEKTILPESKSCETTLERSNSSKGHVRNLDDVSHNLSTMTLNRVPRLKSNMDTDVYVQLTRKQPDTKTAEIYSVKQNGIKFLKSHLEDCKDRRNNALGNFVTWLQRKSPESRESSPFRRSASISGRSISRLSGRSRSFSRTVKSDGKNDRYSDLVYGGSITRRNSFAADRRSFSKNSSLRSKKHSITEESVKSTAITLEEMLKSKLATHTFREFLKSEFSEENLDFWLDCECYKSLKSSKQAKMALKIFSQYLAKSAPREVNIDFETRARTEARLKHPDKNTFVEPQNCIYTLMKCDSFRRFTTSEVYLKMQQSNCQESGSKHQFKIPPRKKKSW